MEMFYMKKFLSLLLCALFLMPMQKVLAFNIYEFEAKAMALVDPSGNPTTFNRENARKLREMLRGVLEGVRDGTIRVDDPLDSAVVQHLGGCFDDDLLFPCAKAILETTLMKILAQINPLYGRVFRALPDWINTAKSAAQALVQTFSGFSAAFQQSACEFLDQMKVYVYGVNVDLLKLLDISLETVRQGVIAVETLSDPNNLYDKLQQTLEDVRNKEIVVVKPEIAAVIEFFGDKLKPSVENTIEEALIRSALLAARTNGDLSKLNDEFRFVVNGIDVRAKDLLNIPLEILEQGQEAVKTYCTTVILQKSEDGAAGLPPGPSPVSCECGTLIPNNIPETDRVMLREILEKYYFMGLSFPGGTAVLDGPFVALTPGLLFRRIAAGHGLAEAEADVVTTIGHEFGHLLAQNSQAELGSRQLSNVTYFAGFARTRKLFDRPDDIESVLQQLAGLEEPPLTSGEPGDEISRKDAGDYLRTIRLTRETCKLLPIVFEDQDKALFREIYGKICEICAGLQYRSNEPRLWGLMVASECWADYFGYKIAEKCDLDPEVALNIMACSTWDTPKIDEQGRVIYCNYTAAYPYGIYRMLVLQELLKAKI
jgi:hypothetical protein